MMGLVGFEPTISSARGWYHTKLDHNPTQIHHFSIFRIDFF
jgi:hypothetical protein